MARLIRLPQAGTLILGGLALALVPGMPPIELDPDFVLVLFLPPLLLLSAYLTDWRAFRADLRIILQLAIGAVIFTTFIVGWVTHLVLPELPLAACFALGAIVSPPDAVAAKAVLNGLNLPSRTITLLEGESLLNDATGLVLYRFAVVATLTGAFSSTAAVGSFILLTVGGVAVGIACGYLVSTVTSRFLDGEMGVVVTFLAAWGSYILGDALDVSGVLATVCCGIVMGWRQHALLDGERRFQSRAVWRVVGFLLESLVFILIGLSLRSVLTRLPVDTIEFGHTFLQVGAVIIAVILSRFLWIIPMSYGVRAIAPALRRRDPYSPLRIPLVMSWAGMRGVVSLAAALALPEHFPGRDFILLATFAVILVTVLVQGTTLAPLIRFLRFDRALPATSRTLSEGVARIHVIAAQIAAVEAVSIGDDGSHRHPRLIEQLQFRLAAVTRAVEANGALDAVRTEHFVALLTAVAGGRAELVRMHRAGEIDNQVLHALEKELDADEIRARHLLTPVGGRAVAAG
ncbi:Na+/H+ antiporter [Lichenicola cladoniae]|uniref:Na+/H+ antiporter n=1 Tax=Lichenicola cladoniae TaxID=1484109 RepID=UPI003083F1C5